MSYWTAAPATPTPDTWQASGAPAPQWQPVGPSIPVIDIESGPYRSPKVGWLAGVIAALLLAAVVAGVVVQGNNTSKADATHLIAAAPGTTARGGAAHFSGTISIDLAGHRGPTFTLSGTSDFADKAYEMQINVGGEAATVRVVAGVEYFQSPVFALPNGAHWVKILPQDLGIGAAQSGLAGISDPSGGLQALGSFVGTPKVLGHETLQGVAVTHYAVTLDLTALIAKVSQAESHLSPAFAQGLKALSGQLNLSHLPAEVWLDGAGRVRQFRLTFAFHTSGLTFSEVETTTFSDFGGTAKVTAPAASDTVPFSAVQKGLGSMLGGGGSPA